MSGRNGSDRAPAWRRYLRFWRGSPEGDVGDEIAFHLQSSIDELLAQGLTPDAAAEAARRRFGDVNAIRKTLTTLSRRQEQHMARTEWVDTVRQDLVFALRQLRKSPGFTLVAVLTLALGIGANSAIFSVVYSVLLRPLPYANAGRVLTLEQRDGPGTMVLPFGNFDVWRHQATDFEAMSASWGVGSQTLTGHGDPTPLATVRATAGFWTVTFIPPAAGRYFTEAEDREGAARVAVLSYALWQNRFGGDRDIVGRAITLEGQPVMVIGVAPPEYILAPPAERIWIPMAAPAWRFNDFADHEFHVTGLLKPGVSMEHAVRQLTEIDTRLAREHPHNHYDGGVIATPLIDSVVGPHRTLLYTLFAAVTLVLLIACGNIANLLLARAAVRRGEIAVRGALGATRARIVSQLLVESALLALGGGVLGVVIAVAGVRFLVSGPAAIPRLQTTTVNAPVLAFAALLSMGCAIVFGLVPAIRAARLDLQQTLRDGGRDSGAATRETLRRALVVSEICVAQVLLIGAGLLIRSSLRLQAVPPGFDTHNLLVVSTNLPSSRYRGGARIEATFQQIDRAIAAIPGVTSVARTQAAPIHTSGWSWTAMREGSNGHDDGSAGADMRFITPGCFSTLGLPVVRGREFTAADGAAGARTAIVSRGLATRLWGDADPIGKRISNSSPEKPDWREVVGVVADMHADGLRKEPPRELYMPSSQAANGGQSMLIRSAVPVTSLLPEIRRAVATVDPLLALSGIETIDQAIGRQAAVARFTTLLLTLLGATGLVLAVVGVYGVIAYFVTQRSHELGVRLALGAPSGSVQWLVVRQALALAGLGVAAGAATALVAARALESMMYGISVSDPTTYLVVGGVLGAAALLASYAPARRATRIDPLEALRSS